MLKNHLLDREFDKFVELSNGDEAVRVTSIGSFAPPAETDATTITYPDDKTEVFKHRIGGVSGTVLATITINYTDSTKNTLVSVVRT
jgi:hypothetical protein